MYDRCSNPFVRPKPAPEWGKEILAANVSCIMPYMGYEPRTLQETLDKRNRKMNLTEGKQGGL